MGRAVLAVIAVLSAFAVSAGTASAAFPGRDGPILTTLEPPSITPFAVASMRPDGTGLRLLTHDPAGTNSLHGSASPGGRLIAFVRSPASGVSDLWIMRADGSHQRQITHLGGTNGDPSWSPNGRLIVFSHETATSHNQIWEVRADGTDPRRIIATAGRDDHSPVFSPSGRWIAFAADRALNSTNIMLARADGSGQHRIAFSLITLSQVSWSPNGRWIAYAGGPATTSSIFAIHPDGTGRHQLSHPPAALGGLDTSPSWSPQGGRIAFSRTACTDPACLTITTTIFVMHADGTDVHSLGHAAQGSFLEPVWGPAPVS